MTESKVQPHAGATAGAGPDAAPPSPPDARPLLSVRRLCKFFPIHSTGLRRKLVGHVKAANDVSFDLLPNETLGLVGESGCGKTTTARAVLRAIRPTSGQVLFRTGTGAAAPASSTTPASRDAGFIDLAAIPERELKALRPHMQMIFQDPFASLNPRMTVGDIVAEPLRIHRLARGSELTDRVDAMLLKVGLKPGHKSRYPHAFSGGQRQRIGIARALIMNPSFVVADEAVSALDVSVQAQVINLLDDLKQEMHLAMVFVAHDLSVVRHICDRVAVMYAGRIVELAPTEALFEEPLHPYTRVLLAAVPSPDPDVKLSFAEGEVADVGRLPAGCAFQPRCSAARPDCRDTEPPLREVAPGRFVACVSA